MGIDYYNCAICEKIFADCGEYGYCSNCESMLCGDCHDEQVSKYDHPEEDSEAAGMYGESAAARCDLCAGVIIRDEDILDYVLSKSGVTREEMKDLMKKEPLI